MHCAWHDTPHSGAVRTARSVFRVRRIYRHVWSIEVKSVRTCLTVFSRGRLTLWRFRPSRRGMDDVGGWKPMRMTMLSHQTDWNLAIWLAFHSENLQQRNICIWVGGWVYQNFPAKITCLTYETEHISTYLLRGRNKVAMEPTVPDKQNLWASVIFNPKTKLLGIHWFWGFSA